MGSHAPKKERGTKVEAGLAGKRKRISRQGNTGKQQKKGVNYDPNRSRCENAIMKPIIINTP